MIQKLIFFISFSLVQGCNQSQNYLMKIDFKFVSNLEFNEKTKLKDNFNQKELKVFYLSDGFLPSGWEFDGTEEFFEIETIQSDELDFLIYAMKLQPKNELIDVRVATIYNGDLMYNYSVWGFSENNNNYSLIKKENDKYIVELYLNSKIKTKYYPDIGLIEHLENK